jgi:Cd2+/Zn2+-exporting ATPase
MRFLLCFLTVTTVMLVRNGSAQEAPGKAEATRATFIVAGLHCEACTTTLEGSLKRLKGIESIKVDFTAKRAMIGFDEKVISAQEVARAMSYTPHAMGPNLHYAGILVLSVEGVKNQAAAKKARAALSKVKGVGKVIVDPRQEAVGIQFTATGKVTSKQLIDTLEKAGLEAAQFSTTRPPSGQ